MKNENLTELLEYINPAECDYQEWVNIGMALKYEGYSISDWEQWSSRDTARYHKGECASKWQTFNGSSSPVTAGTIVQMAKNGGWHPAKESYELDWDAEIGAKEDYVFIDKDWIEHKELNIPSEWNPVQQLITYLETLFEASENVGYVTQSWAKENKYLPSSGNYDRTAGQLIEELNKCNGDLGAVIGDYKEEAGAWIRFNPLDGKGVKNENVTEYRYALVESDSMEIEKQNAIIRELELPVACLVHSGGKSLHAIVKIDAMNYDEYRKRVDYLYMICQKNGLIIDRQNKNPSRLSRMPGIMRRGRKQYLLDTNIGKTSWDEWKEWIEGINDDLPDTESIADIWDNLPELSPPLIDGVLRQGHKMLIAGPSKAGKSYALIELCCAIAEGHRWLEWNCTQGKVLYVNLELDRASCLHRFKDVYTALGWQPKNLANIDVWNLRGKSIPMDKLAPKLIRRANKKNYIAIVIDPIYKIITGDENSADQMAHFCNQFDKVCTELGCAVIYCHHHSKGAQGGKKSMDRASGSGVFARDPDALLDFIELEVTDELIKQEQNKAVCELCMNKLRKFNHQDDVSQDDMCSEKAMLKACMDCLSNEEYEDIERAAEAVRKAVQARTAWRVEGTLREFPKFNALNMWFSYPIHKVDRHGGLQDIQPESEKAGYQRGIEERKRNNQKENEKKREKFIHIVESCNYGEPPTFQQVYEALGLAPNTARDWIKRYGYVIEKNTKTVISQEEYDKKYSH
ncbi:MAG: AAA family ATPase [Oscillospiraceae bacterium]|nr:AAA family ATPase [Oscillospiraceae bacterium]